MKKELALTSSLTRFINRVIVTLVSVPMSIIPAVTYANPQDGTVAAGQATISESGAKLDVHQSTDKAVIDWRKFDIQAGEHTEFHQPSASSMTLNRVNAADPSQIMGKLTANGQVVLVNPNGVFFGKNSKIDVNGIVATSANIKNNDFMAGRSLFTQPGSANAAIINNGLITAQEAGLVGLVAPIVENNGIIIAKLGTVALASGDSFTIEMGGESPIEIEVSSDIHGQMVSNTGVINADGGTVTMTAAAARDVVDSVVSNSGVISANSFKEKNGVITLYAEGSHAVEGNVAAHKGQKSGSSVTVNSGVLTASGLNKGEKGGTVKVLGDQVAILNGSLIDTSGDTGGGTILVGGDYLGKGVTPTAVLNVTDTYTLFYNDAISSGNGGKTILWSDGSTFFRGNIYARGGKHSGDGGFAETSGKLYLDAQGFVDLTATNGKKGTYLLDPSDITIYGNVDPNFISTDSSINLAANLKFWGDASNASKVTLTYSTDSLNSAKATGTSGTKSFTTSKDVASSLAVGSRIRLGNAGTAATADTLGTDTYTIASISGQTITTVESLTANYNGRTLYRGLVSQMADLSAAGNHALQTGASKMPLWISKGQNNLDTMRYDGGDFLTTQANIGIQGAASRSEFVAFNQTNSASQNIIGYGKRATNELADFMLSNGQIIAAFYKGDSTAASSPIYALSTNTLASFLYDGANASIYANGALGNSMTIALNTLDSTLVIGGGKESKYNYFEGTIPEVILYNTSLGNNARQLVDQYQSAKWDVALSAPGTGATEAAKAMASDGYSAFTTRYLERLSATADIVLAASNSITLDLKGDTLALAADKSISLTTTNGNIGSVSSGFITTNRTSTGGNISMTAGGTGTIDVSNVILTAQNGGAISLTSGGAMTLGTMTAGTISARTTGSASDLTIGSGKTLTASAAGNSLTLASGQNFINHAGGSALVTTAGRALVYSKNPTNDILGGLTRATKRYNKTFAAYAPSSVTESGNVFLYSVAPIITVTADDKTRMEGEANPVFTASYSGFIDGDTAATAFSGEAAQSTSATTSSTEGDYTITSAAGTLQSDMGYQFSYANTGTLTVTPAPVITEPIIEPPVVVTPPEVITPPVVVTQPEVVTPPVGEYATNPQENNGNENGSGNGNGNGNGNGKDDETDETTTPTDTTTVETTTPTDTATPVTTTPVVVTTPVATAPAPASTSTTTPTVTTPTVEAPVTVSVTTPVVATPPVTPTEAPTAPALTTPVIMENIRKQLATTNTVSLSNFSASLMFGAPMPMPSISLSGNSAGGSMIIGNDMGGNSGGMDLSTDASNTDSSTEEQKEE